ncbi:eukaryotic translation initiation factor 5A-like protein [Mollisia scopiformis]|uniref:Eukaryotic translation initiation factor 5A-like protein n=1 Tax=Mollisia scopiformis TaxID=149040 RepID=A0A194XU11_MOLSC|nr:eukaryotic translation initiation factor 5A-like protein [Mollisia scopiformis]KUJ23524.1 eukaryotic translation initiation factor 5A-like protein [Mollisia scopiformis]
MSPEEDQYAPEATGDAETSLTYPVQASALRKGGYAMLKSHPCRILELTSAKPGKHGHGKTLVRGRDIFSGVAVEDSWPSSHSVMVPVVKKKSGEKQDVKLPENEIGAKVKILLAEDKPVRVTILAAMGKELCVDAKVGNED